MSEKLLREYVKVVLREDDGGDYFGGDDYGYGSPVSVGGFRAIFVDPFLDVFKTGKAAVADISSKAQYLIGGALGSLVSAFVPALEVDWGELKQKEQERHDRIMQKYDDVFRRTNQALFTGDAALMGFMYDPYTFITAKAAKEAPDVALELVDTLTGEGNLGKAVTEPLRNILSRMKSALGADVEREGPRESIDKANKDLIVEGMLDKLKAFLQKKGVAQAIQSNPSVQKMRKDSEAWAKEHVDSVVQMAKNSVDVRSTDKLNKMSNGKFLAAMKKIKGNERREAAEVVAMQVKNMAKKFFIEKLKADMKQLPDGLQKIYHQGIEQINAL